MAPSLRATGSARSAARRQAPRSNPSRHTKKSLDCVVASAPRNDEEIASPSRGTLRPRFAGYFRDLFKKEGAGNAGCTLHPRSRAQRSGRLRARAYRAAEAIRHSLRNGFTAYNALSPVIGFLATVASQIIPQGLTPAPRRQDHTSSPYASGTVVTGTIRVHRNPPHVRDVADAPLVGTGWQEMCPDLPFGKSEIFLILFRFLGLTRFPKIGSDLPVGQFR